MRMYMYRRRGRQLYLMLRGGGGGGSRRRRSLERSRGGTLLLGAQPWAGSGRKPGGLRLHPARGGAPGRQLCPSACHVRRQRVDPRRLRLLGPRRRHR